MRARVQTLWRITFKKLGLGILKEAVVVTFSHFKTGWLASLEIGMLYNEAGMT